MTKFVIGIYKITNLINNKSYIGQSIDIHKRWKREINAANNINSHAYEYPLMRAFRKYGIDNFSFTIVEECDVEQLNEKEIYWINFYDTFFHGYNQTIGGDAALKQPKEKIIGVISDLTNTNHTHRDIATKWDISIEMVQGINTGRYWKHNADYPLQKRQEINKFYCRECGKAIKKKHKLCRECYNKSNKTTSPNKPDMQSLMKSLYDNQGNFTKTGKEYQVSPTTIRRWCIEYGISNRSSDYKKYNNPTAKKKKTVSVIQLDKDTNEEINRFESITSAVKTIKFEE